MSVLNTPIHSFITNALHLASVYFSNYTQFYKIGYDEELNNLQAQRGSVSS